MTRIFDALRKAQPARSPAAAPRSPAVAAVPTAPSIGARPVAAGASAQGERFRRAVVPFDAPGGLPGDVQREMTGLRVSLELALTQRIPRTVMFIASQGGEGTSTVAAQFARTLAGNECLRILLVDAHARRPAYGPDGSSAGRPEPAARRPSGRSNAANLDLLPLSEESRAERLVPPESLRGALGALASGYDWIVIDGPPVLESPDAATLGTAADGVLVVVQAGRTKRPVLTRAVDMLSRAGGHVLGIVLNRRRLEIPEFIYRRI
jgi:Mrp family chromosome partitioning ATPase